MKNSSLMSLNEIEGCFEWNFSRLLYEAQRVHRSYWESEEIQLCTLLSIKTGGCQEDCGYCPQSDHHSAPSEKHALLNKETVLKKAREAKAKGSTRFCMGAAWRSPPKGESFSKVLDIVKDVKELGLEVCTTLGMLDIDQAEELKKAGVHAYNHNLDTSRSYYEEIIHTRTYDDRLETLQNVQKAGMHVCCGGIVGMGETRKDRAMLIHELTLLNPQPESVPINLLVKVEGTPLDQTPDLDIFELIRTIAVTRIALPHSKVRLSAGRTQMTEEAQALAFLAGANSIFTGEKLLTTPNPGTDKDHLLLQKLGFKPMPEGRVPRALL